MPSQTFNVSGGVFVARLTSMSSQRSPVFLGFPLLNVGLNFRVKCQCQDMVPPAANVLAYSVHQMTVWVMPRCQAPTISKETNNNKQAEEWTHGS